MPRGALPGERRGGRKKGTPNKRTVAVQDAMLEASTKLAKSLHDAFDGDAHALLMAIYKNNALPLDIRLDAAKAAVRYEKSPMPSALPAGESFSIAEEIRRAREILNGNIPAC